MVAKAAYFCRDKYDESALMREIKFLEANSIALLQPLTGLVSTWTSDGDQKFITQEELIQIIKARKNINFQYWLSDSDDLFRTIYFFEAGALEIYNLKGFGELLPNMISILLFYFEEVMKTEVIKGFVIDTLGVTEDYDWSNFFFQQDIYAGVLPDIIGLPHNQLHRLHTNTAECKKRELGNFVILLTCP